MFVFKKSYSIFVSDVNKASVADYRWPALNIDVHGCIIQNNLFETPFFIIYFSGDPYQLQPVFTTTQREQLYSRLVLAFLCILCITIICISRKFYQMTGRNSNKKGFLKVGFFPLCV